MDEINRTVGICNYRRKWGKLHQQRNYGEAAAVISLIAPFEYLVHEHVDKLLKT